MKNGNGRLKRLIATGIVGAGVLSLLAMAPAAEAARPITQACPTGQVPASGFTDVNRPPASDTSDAANVARVTADAIDCVAGFEIAGGFVDNTYRATANISRGQMTTFLLNKLDLVDGFTRPANAPNAFTDDDGTTHEGNIDDAADPSVAVASGVTGDQCNDTTATPNVPGGGTPDFCPSKDVTRGQMATFIVNQLKEAGVDLPANPPDAFTDDNGDPHEANINILAALDLADGVNAAGTLFNPNGFVSRGQMALFISRDVDLLVEEGLVDPLGGGGVPATPGPVSNAPELIGIDENTGEANVLRYNFDEPITGRALRTEVDGTAPSGLRFPDIRLYQPDGDMFVPFEASIFDDHILARFDSGIIASASRATVRFNAVEDVTGLPNLEGDVAMAVASVPVPAQSFVPNLIRVDNYRFASVIIGGQQLVTVDFTFNSNTGVAAALELNDVEANGNDCTATVPPADGNAGEFYLIGSDSATYQGRCLDAVATDATAKTTTFRISFATDPTQVPETQLRRGIVVVGDSTVGEAPQGDPGFVNYDNTDATTADLILSEEYVDETPENGITFDPDLATTGAGDDDDVVVTRISTTLYRFGNDEAVDADTLDADNFFVFDKDGDVTQAVGVARSADADDDAQVVVAEFPALPTAAGDANTPVGVFIADRATRGTDQIQGENQGFSRPAEALLELPEDTQTNFKAGATTLPDLDTVTRALNQVTGNRTVFFKFDQNPCAVIDLISYDLYDANGVQFRQTGVVDADPGVSCNGTTFTVAFSVDDAGGNALFDNEQIEAAVAGAVEDTNATAFTSTPNITEGKRNFA